MYAKLDKMYDEMTYGELLTVDRIFAELDAMGFLCLLRPIEDDAPYKYLFELYRGDETHPYHFSAKLSSIMQLPNYAEVFLDETKWV